MILDDLWTDTPPYSEPSDPKEARGTVIFTGGTASVRGGNGFATFAAGKFGIRALSQSIAREYGPQGVHSCHAIVDGTILTDRMAYYAPKEKVALLLSATLLMCADLEFVSIRSTISQLV